ncbi:hypothetical protein JAAARDRAFT_198058 [Jaapia argillacea MUCL 33604]|uniref:Indoleamine 2,3-dioxygenase n=1 Tax=Jaapia argillacea MUCL 33604 TaxID=933084 RepID=A0A067PFT6_9AGAM|nr:hypothetical protein JAAARDRAFT_198058 [Jaapia argillacea MUCL 33604]
MEFLLPDHFLSLPRPDVNVGTAPGVPDTSTLAAHDFDVDTRTGFMPPQAPLTSLPAQWVAWEDVLADAAHGKLKLGSRVDLDEEDRELSECWRGRVRKLSILPTEDLYKSELLLRRAHHVLSWIMHFYIHTLPPSHDILIPSPITIPLLRICDQLQLPPVLTYSDDVLYNWYIGNADPSDPSPSPTIENLRCITLFTGTRDEEEFYLASARIELRGVEALELMRMTMDEAFVGDSIAFRRITSYLNAMVTVIADMTKLLLQVREGCDPIVFYNEIRPWFKGADSGEKKWVFEGLDEHPDILEPVELSGPSAGQSSLVHALDIFLGVDQYSHSPALTGRAPSTSSSQTDYTIQRSFLSRMQTYMPRHHRAFLRHLSSNPRPLRTLVSSHSDSYPELLEAYNASVKALKKFRDAHMRIVALYIIGPSRKALVKPEDDDKKPYFEEGEEEKSVVARPLKGTGGTDLVRFLKGVRDQTAGAVMSTPVAHELS